MKTAFSAAAVLLFGAVAAHAAPASDRAGVKAPERGVVASEERMPVALERDGFEMEQRSFAVQPEPIDSRGWTGNDNEG